MLPTRLGAVPRLHPGSCERVIVEIAELGEALHGVRHQVGPIPEPRELSPDLGHGAMTRLEEPCADLEDLGGIVDLGALGATLRGGRTTSARGCRHVRTAS